MTFPRPCLEPDCREVVVGAARCDEHTRAVNRSRGSSSARGYGWRWRKRAAKYRREHVLCEGVDPDGRLCLSPSEDVDHIRPVRVGGTDSQDNMQALCRLCHRRKTQEDERRWPLERVGVAPRRRPILPRPIASASRAGADGIANGADDV